MGMKAEDLARPGEDHGLHRKGRRSLWGLEARLVASSNSSPTAF